MAVKKNDQKFYWNYYLALEHDLEAVSRYIEFCESNFSVYSMELARLLFSAASEVDVIAKLLCEFLAPDLKPKNIEKYKNILNQGMPDFKHTEVFLPRYGLSFRPWEEWGGTGHPSWWHAYNNVKHQRDANFNEATLKNALNALGGLLIIEFHYYSNALSKIQGEVLPRTQTMAKLFPQSSLLRLPNGYYHEW